MDKLYLLDEICFPGQLNCDHTLIETKRVPWIALPCITLFRFVCKGSPLIWTHAALFGKAVYHISIFYHFFKSICWNCMNQLGSMVTTIKCYHYLKKNLRTVLHSKLWVAKMLHSFHWHISFPRASKNQRCKGFNLVNRVPPSLRARRSSTWRSAPMLLPKSSITNLFIYNEKS